MRRIDHMFQDERAMDRFFEDHFNHGATGDPWDFVECHACGIQWIYVHARSRMSSYLDQDLR